MFITSLVYFLVEFSPTKKRKLEEKISETTEPLNQTPSTLGYNYSLHYLIFLRRSCTDFVSFITDEEVSSILAALRRNIPKDLPGRETQLEELRETLVTCHEDRTSVSIYICGCPGTGKTITLRTLIALSDVRIISHCIF